MNYNTIIEKLHRDGIVELDIDNVLFETLIKLPRTHTTGGWSARVKHHLSLTQAVKQTIRKSTMFEVVCQYLGNDVVIFDVQQIYGGRRRQLCHRDHDLGPMKCVTLAISDRPLNTRIYTGSHLHDRDMDRPTCDDPFVDVRAHMCVYDTYAAHRGPVEADTRNRFFVECCVPTHIEDMCDRFGTLT